MSLMRAFRNGLIGKLARLRDDVAGVSAVEFAFLLPLMLLLFIGGNQWTEAITIKRKVQLVSRTVADLVAQDTGVSDAEINTIFDAAKAVMQPFGSSPLQVIVSRVDIDANGNAKIGWSDSWPAGSARVVNTTVTLPWTASTIKNTMNMASTVMVWAETTYTYTPPVAFTLFSSTNTGNIPLSDQTFFRQRTGTTITRCTSGC
jgi:Flp pilus assembly protein TadG